MEKHEFVIGTTGGECGALIRCGHHESADIHQEQEDSGKTLPTPPVSTVVVGGDVQGVVAEIRERANDAGLVSYDLTREVPTVCQLCSGAMDDHKGDCLLADLHTLLGIIDQLSQPGDDGGEDKGDVEVATGIVLKFTSSKYRVIHASDLLVNEIATALTAAREVERERAARVQFAGVVPVDQVWTVAIGSLGLKLYESKSDAEQCCGAINFAIAAAIRAPSDVSHTCDGIFGGPVGVTANKPCSICGEYK